MNPQENGVSKSTGLNGDGARIHEASNGKIAGEQIVNGFLR